MSEADYQRRLTAWARARAALVPWVLAWRVQPRADTWARLWLEAGQAVDALYAALAWPPPDFRARAVAAADLVRATLPRR